MESKLRFPRIHRSKELQLKYLCNASNEPPSLQTLEQPSGNVRDGREGGERRRKEKRTSPDGNDDNEESKRISRSSSFDSMRSMKSSKSFASHPSQQSLHVLDRKHEGRRTKPSFKLSPMFKREAVDNNDQEGTNNNQRSSRDVGRSYYDNDKDLRGRFSGDGSLAYGQRLKKQNSNMVEKVKLKFESLEQLFDTEVDEIYHLLNVIRNKQRGQRHTYKRLINTSASIIQRFMTLAAYKSRRAKNRGARDIQRVWRGYTTRVQIRRLKIRKRLRMVLRRYQLLKLLEREKEEAAVTIQKSFRKRCCRQKLRIEIANRKAARLEKERGRKIVAGRVIRCFRVLVARRRKEHLYKLQTRGAICIQTSYRRHVDRRKYLLHLLKVKSARLIQKAWRKCVGRFRVMRARREKEGERIRRKELQKQRAAVQVQKVYRGHAIRKRMDEPKIAKIRNKGSTKKLKRRGGGYDLDSVQVSRPINSRGARNFSRGSIVSSRGSIGRQGAGGFDDDRVDGENHTKTPPHETAKRNYIEQVFNTPQPVRRGIVKKKKMARNVTVINRNIVR